MYLRGNSIGTDDDDDDDGRRNSIGTNDDDDDDGRRTTTTHFKSFQSIDFGLDTWNLPGKLSICCFSPFHTSYQYQLICRPTRGNE